MNKKGFTLVELIMVIIILGIIGAMTIPMVLESLATSREKSGKSVEDMLISNLKMYNKDNMEDLWCDPDDYLDDNGDLDFESFTNNCVKTLKNEPNHSVNSDFTEVTTKVSIDELKKRNPDIDLGECLIKEDSDNEKNLFIIQKIIYLEEEKDVKIEYEYKAPIKCSKGVGTAVYYESK